MIHSIKSVPWLFAQPVEFRIGATKAEHFPESSLPQICFWGRSNVGKSSLLNKLVNRKSLARISVTPGRTQQINFFTLADFFYLVDLPGYGYAKASKKSIRDWTHLIEQYLELHPATFLFLLIDGRHGPKGLDEEVVMFLQEKGIRCQILITKADKLKNHADQALTEIAMAPWFPLLAPYNPLITSSEKGWGMDALRAQIYQHISI